MQTESIIIKREKLHQFINSIAEKKIEAMYTMFENEIEDESINVEAYNKEIEEAEKEIDAGNYFTHEQVITSVKTWQKK